jgi:hypothetical protein
MVEADGHLKLLPTSILDIYKVFEHTNMLFMGIECQPYTVIPTLLLGSDFGVLGHWSVHLNDLKAFSVVGVVSVIGIVGVYHKYSK